MTVILSVELDEEENEDLKEFVKHHPELAKNPAEALKKMAGLKTYRKMKESADPERKKASMLPQDSGMPTILPCAWVEDTKKLGFESYTDFLIASKRGYEYLKEKADNGDEWAKGAIKALFIHTPEGTVED